SNLDVAKPGVRRAALPPFGIGAPLGIDPIGIDLLKLLANPLYVNGRKWTGEYNRAIDHSRDVTSAHVVHHLPPCLSGLRRKSSHRAKIHKADFIIGTDDDVCRMRIGMEKKLFEDFCMHDGDELARQRAWLDALLSQLRKELLIIGVDRSHELPHPNAGD